MKTIMKWLIYDGMEKEDYATIKPEIYDQSRRRLSLYSQVLAFAFFLLFFCTFFISAIAAYRILYLIMSLGSCAAAYVFHTIAKSNKVIGRVMKYILEIVILSFGIIIGIVTSSNMPAVAFVVLIGMLPLLIYDNMIRSLLLRVLMICVYFGIASKSKSVEALETDLINLLSFTILSTLCVIASNHTQVKGIYLDKYMQKEIANQTATIQQNLDRIEALSVQTISAFVKSIDAKDRYTNGHSLRVAKYAKMIAAKLGKSDDEQHQIYYSALMHDVGKIGIPDAIINKPTKLTDEEFEVIKQHTVIGHHILGEIDELPDSAMGAYLHHERYDGRGYPLGLSGTQIPEIARIIAVADSYDAMTSNRSYRKLLPQKVAAEEIRKGRGTQFDPAFADVMLEIIQEDKNFLLHE